MYMRISITNHHVLRPLLRCIPLLEYDSIEHGGQALHDIVRHEGLDGSLQTLLGVDLCVCIGYRGGVREL